MVMFSSKKVTKKKKKLSNKWFSHFLISYCQNYMNYMISNLLDNDWNILIGGNLFQLYVSVSY